MIYFLIMSMLVFAASTRLAKNKGNHLSLVFFSLSVNLSIIFFEQLYLENTLQRSFHFSDPSNYYDETHKLSLDNLLKFVFSDEYKSNQFYYVVNWIYHDWVQNSTAASISLRITNCLFFYSAFIFASSNKSKNSTIDSAILLHPYLAMLLIRNVRDAYIILFLILFIYVLEEGKLNTTLKWIGVVLTITFMSTIRPFFIAIMALIAFNKGTSTRIKRLAIIPISIALSVYAYINFSDISAKLFSAVFSTISAHEGFDEERDNVVTNLIVGEGAGLDFWISTIKRILIGVPVFLFTPNPISYLIKYLQENRNGIWGIYTQFDNIMIILGAIFNYIFVYPIIFKGISQVKNINSTYASIAFFMFLSYVIFQLGITDTRIKYTFLVFVLMGMRNIPNLFDMRKIGDLKYLAISLTLMLGLSLV